MGERETLERAQATTTGAGDGCERQPILHHAPFLNPEPARPRVAYAFALDRVPVTNGTYL